VKGDTDYVASGTVGDLDLYDVADLGVTPDSFQAVQVTLCARKDDAARCAVGSSPAQRPPTGRCTPRRRDG